MVSETTQINSPPARPNPNRQNVAVVGGSAAGLFTASLLARKGFSVRVYERIESLQPEARTLIVTQRMRSLLGPAAEKSIVNEIRRFELFTDGRSASIALKEPDLIIERRMLIQALAEQAQKAGVALELGWRFRSMHPNGKGLALELERSDSGAKEQFHADTVVGGDGVSSSVAKAAGWSPLQTVPLIQAIVRLPKDMVTDTSRVWFIPQDTPYFYWLIPESPTTGAVGLIGEHGSETKHLLERFLEKRNLEPIDFQGARIPVYSRWVPVCRKVGSGFVYLVGDAAGQVKVTTVGGIVTGFRGAIGVAESILNGGTSSELRTLRRELNLHLLLRRSLHRFQQADYSRLVDLLNDPARQMLSKYSRDEAWKVLWRIGLRQPRLILLALRGLLMSRSSLQQPAG